LADVGLDFVSAVAQLCSDLKNDDIIGSGVRRDGFGSVYFPKYAACRLGIAGGACLGIAEIVLEGAGAVVVVIGSG